MAERCAKGQELFDIRAKALAGMEGLGIGKIVGTPDTPQAIAEQQKSEDAMKQVATPASHYNYHVEGCQECKDFDHALAV